MRIVIVRAGSVGRSVTLELLNHGREHTFIDNQPNRPRVASVAGAGWVLVDARSPNALADAGLVQADVMVVTIGDDKANLVIPLLAKIEFVIPRIATRLNNLKNEWPFDASWGVGVPMSTSRVMTALVDEAVSVSIPVRLLSFSSTEVSIYTIVLPEESPLVGCRIVEVDLPSHTVLTSLLRSEHPVTPSDDDIFETEDELLLPISNLEKNVPDTLIRLVKVPEPEVNEKAGEQA